MIYYDYTPFETRPEAILRNIAGESGSRRVRWGIAREFTRWPAWLRDLGVIYPDAIRWDLEWPFNRVFLGLDDGTVHVHGDRKGALYRWPALAMAEYYDSVAEVWRFDATSDAQRMALVNAAVRLQARSYHTKDTGDMVHTTEIGHWALYVGAP